MEEWSKIDHKSYKQLQEQFAGVFLIKGDLQVTKFKDSLTSVNDYSMHPM